MTLTNKPKCFYCFLIINYLIIQSLDQALDELLFSLNVSMLKTFKKHKKYIFQMNFVKFNETNN